MSDIKVSLHLSDYKTKPSADQLKRIKDDLFERTMSFKLGSIGSFAQLVGEEEHAFRAATFRSAFYASTIKDENFEQAQLFTLDFGEGVTFEEVREKTELYDLPILFAYVPFSDDSRFRVVFLNDAPVTDLYLAAAMQQALLIIFPKAVPGSEKVWRICLGGKKLLHFDSSLPMINIESLFRGMSFALMKRHGKNNYRRKIIEFSKNIGIGLNRNNLLDISIEETLIDDEIMAAQSVVISNENISPSSIIILSNTDNGEKFSKRYIINPIGNSSNPSINKEKSSIHRPYRSNDLRTIESTCRLYQEFQSGNKPLSPGEIFGLATNLVRIEAGAARFKSILRSCVHSLLSLRSKVCK